MPTNLKNKPIFLVVVATLHNEYCVKYSILGDFQLYLIWISKNNHILNVICSIYLSKEGN